MQRWGSFQIVSPGVIVVYSRSNKALYLAAQNLDLLNTTEDSFINRIDKDSLKIMLYAAIGGVVLMCIIIFIVVIRKAKQADYGAMNSESAVTI